MHVIIVETKTGKVVGRYSITVGSLNEATTEENYFSEAWDTAVEDGDVDANDRDKYSFRLDK